MGLREEILAIQDMGVEPFPTPEWPSLDGKVFIRTITSRDKGMMEKQVYSGKTGELAHIEKLTPVGCAMYLSDADGNRIFSDDDIEALSQKCAGVLERAFRAGQKLNGFTPESIADAEKNSGGMNTDDSSTPFPLPLE